MNKKLLKNVKRTHSTQSKKYVDLFEALISLKTYDENQLLIQLKTFLLLLKNPYNYICTRHQNWTVKFTGTQSFITR